MKEGVTEGTKMYLYGGGNSLPMHMQTAGAVRSAIFCKEVTVITRPLGNTQRKTWVAHGEVEQLVRNKTLAGSWLEAYLKLGNRVKIFTPSDKVQELIKHMDEFHPEHLI